MVDKGRGTRIWPVLGQGFYRRRPERQVARRERVAKRYHFSYRRPICQSRISIVARYYSRQRGMTMTYKQRTLLIVEDEQNYNEAFREFCESALEAISPELAIRGTVEQAYNYHD